MKIVLHVLKIIAYKDLSILVLIDNANAMLGGMIQETLRIVLLALLHV